MFNTLQDRLIKEMRLMGISSMAEGNQYLEEYIKQHNEFFSVSAKNSNDVHRSVSEERLEEVFCYKDKESSQKG